MTDRAANASLALAPWLSRIQLLRLVSQRIVPPEGGSLFLVCKLRAWRHAATTDVPKSCVRSPLSAAATERSARASASVTAWLGRRSYGTSIGADVASGPGADGRGPGSPAGRREVTGRRDRPLSDCAYLHAERRNPGVTLDDGIPQTVMKSLAPVRRGGPSAARRARSVRRPCRMFQRYR